LNLLLLEVVSKLLTLGYALEELIPTAFKEKEISALDWSPKKNGVAVLITGSCGGMEGAPPCAEKQVKGEVLGLCLPREAGTGGVKTGLCCVSCLSGKGLFGNL